MKKNDHKQDRLAEWNAAAEELSRRLVKHYPPKIVTVVQSPEDLRRASTNTPPRPPEAGDE